MLSSTTLTNIDQSCFVTRIPYDVCYYKKGENSFYLSWCCICTQMCIIISAKILALWVLLSTSLSNTSFCYHKFALKNFPVHNPHSFLPQPSSSKTFTPCSLLWNSYSFPAHKLEHGSYTRSPLYRGYSNCVKSYWSLLEISLPHTSSHVHLHTTFFCNLHYPHKLGKIQPKLNTCTLSCMPKDMTSKNTPLHVFWRATRIACRLHANCKS